MGQMVVAGWVAAAADDVVVTLVGSGDARQVLALIDRPDVSDTFGLRGRGFRVEIDSSTFRSELDTVFLEITIANESTTIFVPTREMFVPEPDRRTVKMTRLLPLLKCVVCGGIEMRRGLRRLRCARCRRVVANRSTAFPLDQLPDELRAESGVVPTDNVSANDYDPIALDLIQRLHDGLILDCGAGLRSVYHHNVVNLEVVAYATTDVLAVGERLPFQDASFDCVFSFAVLEHVKDPFACAREIMRVLKPGGIVYAQIPFLQPLHAFPHHYYNMTVAGSTNLFHGLDVAQAGVFPFGEPVFMLSWILNRYAAGLPPMQRADFMTKQVSDLVGPGYSYLGSSFVTALAPATREELACCNFVLARKPAP
jgi:SAM-dependent methyltransferase